MLLRPFKTVLDLEEKVGALENRVQYQERIIQLMARDLAKVPEVQRYCVDEHAVQGRYRIMALFKPETSF
jgi:hypothetical protein